MKQALMSVTLLVLSLSTVMMLLIGLTTIA